jgi:hypothetical protein
MISALPLPLRRLLFIALNAAAALACYGLLLAPLLDLHAGNTARIEELERLNGRLRAVAEQRPRIEREIAASAPSAIAREVWTGQTPSAVSATVQARLRELADAAEIRLRSLSALPGSEEGILIRIEASARLEALLAFLAAIESETPYLFVAAGAFRQPSVRGSSANAEEAELEVQIDVSALLRKVAP